MPWRGILQVALERRERSNPHVGEVNNVEGTVAGSGASDVEGKTQRRRDAEAQRKNKLKALLSHLECIFSTSITFHYILNLFLCVPAPLRLCVFPSTLLDPFLTTYISYLRC
jgi:hypothetical protein